VIAAAANYATTARERQEFSVSPHLKRGSTTKGRSNGVKGWRGSRGDLAVRPSGLNKHGLFKTLHPSDSPSGPSTSVREENQKTRLGKTGGNRGRRALLLPQNKCRNPQGRSADFQSVAPISNIFNLLYRRIVFYGPSMSLGALGCWTVCRLQIGDTAD